MREIVKIISSRKTAIVLLALTIFFSLVGTTLFDKNQFGEYAKSWWFISVIAFLLLSTATCTIQRTIVYRSKKKITDIELSNFESKIITKKGIFEGYSTLDAELKKNGYKTELRKVDRNTFKIFALKGQSGFWGSIIFHISFLVIGLGAIFSLAFKFSGDFILVEGETFSDYFGGYMNVETGLLYKNNHGQYQLQFKDFEPRVSNNKRIQLKDDYSEDYISSISIIDNYQTVKEAQLGVNQKVRYKGFAINPDYYGHGYAPKLEIKKVKGTSDVDKKSVEPVFSSYLVLNTDFRSSYDEVTKVMSKVSYKDEIKLDSLNWKLKINFLPNKPKDGEKVVEPSAFAKDPLLSIQVYNLKDESLIHQGVVHLQEPVKIGAYVLEFTEVKQWQRFLVRKDRGQEIVYLGFFLGIVGLCLRFTQYRRQVQGQIRFDGEQTIIYLKESVENKSLQKSHLDQLVSSLRGISYD